MKRPDQNKYYLGIFYYNPDDKRIFVPKMQRRFGITLNFAHPVSWIIVTALLLLVCVAVWRELNKM